MSLSFRGQGVGCPLIQFWLQVGSVFGPILVQFLVQFRFTFWSNLAPFLVQFRSGFWPISSQVLAQNWSRNFAEFGSEILANFRGSGRRFLSNFNTNPPAVASLLFGQNPGKLLTISQPKVSRRPGQKWVRPQAKSGSRFRPKVGPSFERKCDQNRPET